MNKKARKAAVKSALSMLYKNNKLSVLDKFNLSDISTKSFVSVLNAFDITKTLIITEDRNSTLELSSRNVKDVKVVTVERINVFDIVKYNNVILTQDAIRKVEGALQS